MNNMVCRWTYHRGEQTIVYLTKSQVLVLQVLVALEPVGVQCDPRSNGAMTDLAREHGLPN